MFNHGDTDCYLQDRRQVPAKPFQYGIDHKMTAALIHKERYLILFAKEISIHPNCLLTFPTLKSGENTPKDPFRIFKILCSPKLFFPMRTNKTFNCHSFQNLVGTRYSLYEVAQK